MTFNRPSTRRSRLNSFPQSLCMLIGVLAAAPTVEAGVIFFDDFEEQRNWQIFEEIVGPCYGGGIGEVATAAEYATSGDRSLRVWANKARSGQNNHVIAGYKLANPGAVTGRVRYELDTFMDPATSGQGQTGPEFSLQRTQWIPEYSDYRTMIGGIQFVPNPYLPRGTWNVWTEQSPGVAGWQDITGLDLHLTSGRWYHMALEVDFAKNEYISMAITGEGVDETIDLSGYAIAEEVRFRENALWMTLESEDIWQPCDAPGNEDFKMHYDNALLQSISIPEPATASLLAFAVLGVPVFGSISRVKHRRWINC